MHNIILQVYHIRTIMCHLVYGAPLFMRSSGGRNARVMNIIAVVVGKRSLAVFRHNQCVPALLGYEVKSRCLWRNYGMRQYEHTHTPVYRPSPSCETPMRKKKGGL